MRTEPPESLPERGLDEPEPSAAALPPLDPPATRSAASGFGTSP